MHRIHPLAKKGGAEKLALAARFQNQVGLNSQRDRVS